MFIFEESLLQFISYSNSFLSWNTRNVLVRFLRMLNQQHNKWTLVDFSSLRSISAFSEQIGLSIILSASTALTVNKPEKGHMFHYLLQVCISISILQ